MHILFLLCIPVLTTIAVLVLPVRLTRQKRLAVLLCGGIHLILTGDLWAVGDSTRSYAPSWLAVDAIGLISLSVISLSFFLGALYLQGEAQRSTYWKEPRLERIGITATVSLLFAATTVCLAKHYSLIVFGSVAAVIVALMLRRLGAIPYFAAAILSATANSLVLACSRFLASMNSDIPVHPFLAVYSIAVMTWGLYKLFTVKTMKSFLLASTVFHTAHVFFLGSGIPLAAWPGVYHFIGAAIVHTGLLLIAGNIEHPYRIDDIARIVGLRRAMPLNGVVWFAGLLALAGLPPFCLFLSEFSFAVACVAEGRIAIGVAYLAVMTAFALKILNIGLAMLRGDPSDALRQTESESRLMTTPGAIAVVIALTLGLGVPGFLGTATTKAARTVDRNFTTIPGIRP